MFGNKLYIRTMNFDGSHYQRLPSSHEYTHVLDYHYQRGYIFYADTTPSRSVTLLKRINMRGGNMTTVENMHALGVEGIAVDWIGE